MEDEKDMEMVPKELEDMTPKTTMGTSPIMRMLTDVLVEPSNTTAPTKRRRGKARRKLTNLGKISDFFPKLLIPKEWKPDLAKEGGAALEMRKRKCMELVEDHATCTTNAKSRRIGMKETDVTKSTTNSMYLLGAKSISRREPTDRRKRETTNWVEIKNDCSELLPRDLDSKTEKRINTQGSQ